MYKRSSSVLPRVLAGTAALVFAATGCNDKAPQVSAASAPSAEVAAEVAKVQRGSIAHTLSLAGQFQPYQVVDVHAKVSGYVRHIYVDIGDRVHAGQTLATLEVPELSAQLKGTVSEVAHSKDEITRAQNMVSRAESEHSSLHANYLRLQQAAAAQPGLIAEQELDDAHAKDMSAEAEVDGAKAALSAARQQSGVAAADQERVGALAAYSNVTAPLNGVIVWRYADTGALIQAGTASDVQSLPVARLSQSDQLRLRLPVPEDAVEYIHQGAQVQLHVDAVHRSFTGTVVRFTRNVSPDTRTMETEVDVPNKDLSLTPGMYANTRLQLEHKDNILTIPVQAVMRDGDRASVFVLDRTDHVQPRPVTLGLQGSTLIEVTGGLAEGERVILGGQAKYQPGEQVKANLRQEPANDVMQEAGGTTDESAAEEGNQ